MSEAMSESALRRADEAISGKLAGLKVRLWCPECRKWRYQTEAEALEELAQIRREFGDGKRKGRKMERGAYPCPSSEAGEEWHLTSQKPRRARRVRFVRRMV